MRSFSVLAAFLLTGSLACSSDGDIPDAGSPDLGPADSGIQDTGPIDMGPVDTGVAPVCGNLPNDCNPVDGTGCTGADEFCVLSPNSPQSYQCRLLIPAPPVGEGEVCVVSQRNCAAGHVCVQFQGEPDPLCYKVCDSTGGGATPGCGCETTTASTTCTQFAGSGIGRPRFGTCQTP